MKKLGKNKHLFSRIGVGSLRLFEVGVLILLVMSIGNLFFNSSQYRRIVPIDQVQVLIWIALFFILLWAREFFLTHWKKCRIFFVKHKISIMVAGTIFLFLFQLWFAKNTYTEIGWDCSTVVLQGDPEGDPFYFLTYPNNILLAFLYKAANHLAYLFGIYNVWAVCIGVNILFLDLGIVFGMLACKKLLPTRGYYLSFVLMISVVGLSPYLTVPYSDTMALPFPAAIFFFLLLYREQQILWKKAVLAFFLGAATLMGYWIKPTVVIVWIAYGIWLLLKKKGKMDKTAFLRFSSAVGAFILGLGMVIGIQNLAKEKILGPYNQQVLFYENEIPMTHFMMMGLYDEGGLFGAYYGKDLDTTKSIQGKKEKISYNLLVIRQRLIDYGFTGFLQHLYHKYIWITTDGTFFYGGEGHFHRDIPKTETGVRGLLQNFTYCETPFYQQYYGQYLHAIWASLLFGNAWYAFISVRKKGIGMEFVMQMSILGLFLFLLLFEARSRYLFLYLPFFILLASRGILGLKSGMQNKLFRKRKTHTQYRSNSGR